MSESKNQLTLLDEWVNEIQHHAFKLHVSGLHKLHQLHFIARLKLRQISRRRQTMLAALNEVPPAYLLPWIMDQHLSKPNQSKIDFVKDNIVDAVTTGDWKEFLTELDST